MGLATALAEVVAGFRGVSVVGEGIDTYKLRAVSDPGDIQLPTVWIPLPDVDFQYSKARLDVTWTAYLIPPNAPKQRTATDHLSAMIDSVTGLYPFTTGELFNLTMQGGVSAAAYKLQWRSTIRIGA